MTTKIPLETVADRAWFAYLCLPRNANGDPPTYRSLEGDAASGKPAYSTLSKLFRGDRDEPDRETREKIAVALKVSIAWLTLGDGEAPKLVADYRVIPRDTGLRARDPEAWRRRYGSGTHLLNLPANNWLIAVRFMGNRVCDEAMAEVAREAEGRENDREPFEWGAELVKAHHRLSTDDPSWRHGS